MGRKAANIAMKENLEGTPTIQKLKADSLRETQDILREAAFTGVVAYNRLVHEFKPLSVNPIDWVVSEMYPISKDSQGKISELWVDKPKTKKDLALCEKKKEIMKKLGKRYIVVSTQPDLHGFMSDLAAVDADLQGAFIE